MWYQNFLYMSIMCQHKEQLLNFRINQNSGSVNIVYVVYSNISTFLFFFTFFIRRGSVITDFTVYFDYVNVDQGLIIIDQMDVTGLLGDMPVGKFSTNSTKSMFYLSIQLQIHFTATFASLRCSVAILKTDLHFDALAMSGSLRNMMMSFFLLCFVK